MRRLSASLLLALAISWTAFAEEPILPVKTLSGHPGGVYSLAFSSDSRVLVSAGQNGLINLWDFRDFRSIRTWKDHGDSVNSIFFSPDQKRLISGSDDQTIMVRNATDYSIVDKISMGDRVSFLAQSAKGETFAAVLGEKTIKFISAEKYEPFLKSYSGSCAAFSPQPYGMAAIGTPEFKIRILNVSTGWGSFLKGRHKAGIRTLAYNADGTLLASGSADQTVKIWHSRNSKLVKSISVKDTAVQSVAFSPDGKYLVFGGTLENAGAPDRAKDFKIFVYDLRRWRKSLTLSGHRGAILALAFSPDGKWLVSGSADKTIRVWNVRIWDPRHAAVPPIGKTQ